LVSPATRPTAGIAPIVVLSLDVIGPRQWRVELIAVAERAEQMAEINETLRDHVDDNALAPQRPLG